MTQSKDKSNRIIYIEILRILAAFFVVFNHTNLKGFMLYSKYPENSIHFWVYIFFSVFCKFAVPTFFAISGAMLLNKKDQSLKEIFKQKILKHIIIIIIFSIPGYFITCGYLGITSYSFKDFFYRFCKCDNYIVLWYLYAYILFLACLPFIRAMVKNLKDTHYIYLFILAVIFKGFVPILEYLALHKTQIVLEHITPSWLICDIILYPLLGYYIHHRLEVKKIKKHLPLMWIINIVTIYVSCYMTYYRCNLINTYEETKVQLFYNNFAPINMCVIFITIKYLLEGYTPSDKIKKIILSFTSCSYGIYLLHFPLAAMPSLNTYFERIYSIGINAMLTAFIYCILVTLISWLIVLMLKRIPIINKLL